MTNTTTRRTAAQIDADIAHERATTARVESRYRDAQADACQMVADGATELEAALWLTAAQDRIMRAPWG